MFRPRFCFFFTPYIQKIFSLPHSRIGAGFPKGSYAIFVQGANSGTEVRMGRDSTVMQFLCRDSNGQLCNTFTWGQLMCRGPTVMRYLCRASNGQLCNSCARVQLMCRGSNGQPRFPRWPLCPRLQTAPCGPLSLSLSRASPHIRRQTSQIGEKSACFIFSTALCPPNIVGSAPKHETN